MFRASIICLVSGLSIGSSARAQAERAEFRWLQGQVLAYRVEHTTSAMETAGQNKTETRTKLNLSKQWQVLKVDETGVATLQLILTALRLETTTPGGGVLLFDSTDPEKSDGQMRDQLTKFIGQPLAVLRIDARGKVVDVKESKHGPASRFESELPFGMVLPDGSLTEGRTWERSYKITIEPPQGTGEKYDTTQKYTCNSVAEGFAKVALATTVRTLPESLMDRLPLLQMQPEGEVVFDVRSGRMQRIELRINQEITGHQGEGTSHRFQSNYVEEYQPKP